jgi:hypothetical protein
MLDWTSQPERLKLNALQQSAGTKHLEAQSSQVTTSLARPVMQSTSCSLAAAATSISSRFVPLQKNDSSQGG